MSSISYSSNTNVYFINHKLGPTIENKRGGNGVKLYTLAYKLDKTLCHYYGGFIEDEWIYNETNSKNGTPLKNAIYNVTNYEDACTEESISYFL